MSEQVRSIKTYTITEPVGGRSRQFSGKVKAAETSNLSFAVSGTVDSVAVKLGEQVKEGQVLAVLDREPFRLDVQAAQASLEKAKAEHREKKQEFERNKDLFQKGWMTRVAMEQAQTAVSTALSDVNYATSKLNLAKRNLDNATLRAPFGGVVGERDVEAHTDVTAGQRIFAINVDGVMDVSISLPEGVIGDIRIGMPASVRINAIEGLNIAGRVTEIGAVAGAGNVFPVSVSLLDVPAGLRAGMTAEVSLVTAAEAHTEGVLVPLAAIAPGDTQSKGYVYVFEDATSTVRKMPVEASGARDNLIAVRGVNVGDVVAVAGVTFLRDGLKVKLMSAVGQ